MTPMQDLFLVLLSRRNHMSTAKTLEIDICRATEVHLPDQIVRYRLQYDGTRARRPAQDRATPCSAIQRCSSASELAESSMEASTLHI